MPSRSNSPTASHYDNPLNTNGHNYLHSYLDKPIGLLGRLWLRTVNYSAPEQLMAPH